jgi:hypothetical protein
MRELLLGGSPVNQWQPSTNEWDWLGHGIYFWEHSPERALRWAQERLAKSGEAYDTVRGAFLEGDPIYPGAGFSREAHIQIAVRNRACILGVFRPYWI